MVRSTDDPDELQVLQDQVRVAVTFIGSSLPPPVLQSWLDAAASALVRRDRRGLRQMARDVREMIRGMNSTEQEALAAQLRRENLPEDLFVQSHNDKEIRELLKLEKLRTEAEYRLLEEFVERAHDKTRVKARVKKANELLAAFVRTRRPKQR